MFDKIIQRKNVQMHVFIDYINVRYGNTLP